MPNQVSHAGQDKAYVFFKTSITMNKFHLDSYWKKYFLKYEIKNKTKNENMRQLENFEHQLASWDY